MSTLEKQFIDSMTEEDRAAFSRARVTRGPRKGLLLKAPPSPSKDPLAFAAWHGFRAAQHASRWGYLPNDCGTAGMIMHGGGDTFSRVFDSTIAFIKIAREAAS